MQGGRMGAHAACLPVFEGSVPRLFFLDPAPIELSRKGHVRACARPRSGAGAVLALQRRLRLQGSCFFQACSCRPGLLSVLQRWLLAVPPLRCLRLGRVLRCGLRAPLMCMADDACMLFAGIVGAQPQPQWRL